MKALIILATAAMITSAQAKTITQLNCGPNERGASMQVTLTPTESTVPLYAVKMIHQGRVYKQFRAYQTSKLGQDFAAQAHDDEYADTILTVGYSAKSGEAYYQQAANNGMSPLPASFFSKCTVK